MTDINRCLPEPKVALNQIIDGDPGLASVAGSELDRVSAEPGHMVDDCSRCSIADDDACATSEFPRRNYPFTGVQVDLPELMDQYSRVH